jgi:hypothetical protein
MDHIKQLGKTRADFISHQGGAIRRHYTAELKNAAVSLLKYYPPAELASQLKISTKSLRNWQEGSPLISESATFVPLTLSEDVTPFFSPDAESLVLKLPHQFELVLPAKSIKNAAKFISYLIKEMAECSI